MAGDQIRAAGKWDKVEMEIKRHGFVKNVSYVQMYSVLVVDI